ncbi:MAG: hypothetical protein IJ867_05295 [Clostridia bacterium]|nr:hypothetical protein [Clostridia bacterium]
MKRFIYFYLIVLVVLILIGNIALAQEDLELETVEFTSSNFHYNQNSLYSWPLFGYYSISSYFGKRVSPTSRGF